MPDQNSKFTKASIGKLVKATAGITDLNFTYAHKGDYGRIDYVDRIGNPTVLFTTGHSVVVSADEIELVDEAVKAEDDLVNTFFGHHGMCGCDGATDFGCPICTSEKKKAFLEEFRELVKRYR